MFEGRLAREVEGVGERGVATLFVRVAVRFFYDFADVGVAATKSDDALLNVLVLFVHGDSSPDALSFVVVESDSAIWV